ncbi:MAG: prepilin-type N-terminal cleavage/methylation domain-containing protein [Gammaproteobacteria bacterium]|nr:prepilin-type N-terminal cleavage/methylation domain-containing protein [Gammaproteobacteria bacterium]
MTNKTPQSKTHLSHGMTLIELVIVVAIMAILLTLAVPNYRSYTLRVHRSEAIGMLMQASMCQERIHANQQIYNTGQCRDITDQQHYQLTYIPSDALVQSYSVVATPVGAQHADQCGSLSLNQNGARGISATNISVTKCWNGR